MIQTILRACDKLTSNETYGVRTTLRRFTLVYLRHQFRNSTEIYYTRGLDGR